MPPSAPGPSGGNSIPPSAPLPNTHVQLPRSPALQANDPGTRHDHALKQAQQAPNKATQPGILQLPAMAPGNLLPAAECAMASLPPAQAQVQQGSLGTQPRWNMQQDLQPPKTAPMLPPAACATPGHPPAKALEVTVGTQPRLGIQQDMQLAPAGPEPEAI